MNTCDIIIPTYNSAQVLPLTLAALQEQEVPDGWQVGIIISDDGSTDETVSVTPRRNVPITNYELQITVLSGSHAGAASARNRAVAASTADVVLFLGADILLRPSTLATHLNFHYENRGRALAAVGMVRWDPRLPPSPFMEWMVHSGPQNDFDSLLGNTTADIRHFFYGSHLSIRRDLLPANGFPTDYQSYGWEDLDLGRQLAGQGVQAAVLHNAVGLHHHAYTVDDVYQRQRLAGQGVGIYQQRYPRADIMPPFTHTRYIKMVVYRFSSLRLFLLIVMRALAKKYSLPRVFLTVTAAEFWVGVWEFEKKRKKQLDNKI